MSERRFQRVAVLMGGPSAEREVSLRSGAAVAAGLQARGYEVTSVDVRGYDAPVPAGAEAVFIALHGTFGEDGSLQALLEARGIPFTGSGSAASRLAFDKIATKRCLESCGVPTPPWEILGQGAPPPTRLPVVVKPPRQGSSIGVSRVAEPGQWPAALADALQHDEEVLVETFIPGAELTVGVVGDRVLPVVEIRAPGGSYDYGAKYTKGVTEYLCPAPLAAEVTSLCQALAWRTFEALGCRGMGRVDIRMDPEGRPFVLELNTIPGFTETSLLPKAARAAGIEFPELCETVLNLAGQ